MIGLGLRLSVGGGREGWTRLLAIGAGVMIGTTLLLLAVSGLQILESKSSTPCWRCTPFHELPQDGTSVPDNALLWRITSEMYDGKDINRADIAAIGHDAPTIPGIDRTVQPGEYYVSPAVAELLKTVPADQLGNRFPGKLVGVIGSEGLRSPGDLVVVVGHAPNSLQQQFPHAGYITELQTTPEERHFDRAVIVMFLVVVGGLLFAMWSLVMAATRLGGARREEKFATLRLFGATPRQIMTIAAVDAALSAAIGVAAATILFYVAQPFFAHHLARLANVYPEQFTPGFIGWIVVAGGVMIVSVTSALFSLRRVRLTPLGASRKATKKSPGTWRIVPLLLGLGILLTVWLINKDLEDTLQKAELTQVFLAGFGLTLLGIALIGSWLTQQLARLLARMAAGAPSLLAARRLADDPKGAFRSVQVLVIAAFLAALMATFTPLLTPNFSSSKDNQLAVSSVYFSEKNHLEKGGVKNSEIEATLQTLRAIPGVAVVPWYVESLERGDSPFSKDTFARCSDVVTRQSLYYLEGSPSDSVPEKRTSLCETAAANAVIRVPASVSPVLYESGPPTVSQAEIVYKDISNFPVQSLEMSAVGQIAVEKVRTIMAQHPNQFGNGSGWWMTPAEIQAGNNNIARYVELIISGILLIILFVAGCSLAVSAGGGIVERKRPFGLLRVAGMSIGQLRRVVLYETAVPLVLTTLVASVLGFVVGALLIKSFAHPSETTVEAPPLEFYGIIGLGICLALLIILATMPLLNAVTKPEKARFE